MQRSPALYAVIAALALPSPALATDALEEPEVSSYGSLQVRRPEGVVAMPLAHTEVDAHVAGFVASVRVEQTFENPFDEPIEAVYVFPLPQRAAVHAMTLKVGERTIRGEVKKRAEAKQVYEAAKAAGQTAALLDQERPNVFTQSVANILPGDSIRVTLRLSLIHI